MGKAVRHQVASIAAIAEQEDAQEPSQNAPLETSSYQDRGERVVNTPQFRVLLRAKWPH
ncbi:hypothetical protein GCM10011608_42400 [Micromonospora sonchi]|uniref:Uncharacterized protein n=1 Tax=Micromonospora sonchi TaxID=1763543 RepID=A0A917U270_9ACTN|nr:hypothetical protein GCM10011608_42400 [Micromonospora sonchi]